MSSRRPRSESELADYLRSLDTPAPAGLRSQILALEAPSRRAGRRRRRPVALAVACALVIVALLALRTGRSAVPNLQTVASLGARPATEAAPARSAGDPATLRRAVDGIAFPYWQEYGMRAVGARSDALGGRSAVTVFYRAPRGTRVAYTILSGTPAPSIAGGVPVWSGSTEYRELTAGGRHELAWLERGRLCVISVDGPLSRALTRDFTS